MRRLLVVLGLAASVVGCDSPTVAVPDELVGRWQSARESLQPAGSYQTTFTFSRDGRVTVDVRSYGLYPGQHSDDLAAYSLMSGTFHVDGAALTIVPQTLVSWDSFFGPDSSEQVVTPYAGKTYSQLHYSLMADRLTLYYMAAPADAPIPTTATFVRAQ